MGYIYKITNPINMIYVGQTISLRKRIVGYMRCEFEKTHGGIINESFRIFGFEAHTFQVLEKNVPIEKLSEREEYWIKKLNSVNFFNHAGMNKNRFDRRVMDRIKNKENYKDSYDGIEEWDFKPFTGAEFLEKSKELKRKLTAIVNKRTNRTFPKWSTDALAEKLKKKIVCYDVNGNYLETYPSTIDAVRILGINRSSIKDSLRKGSWSRGKYMFRYWEENFPMTIDVGKVNLYFDKKEVLMFNESWDFIEEYYCAEKAAVVLGVHPSTIRRLAYKKGLIMLRNSYRFVYKEDYGSLNPSVMGGGNRK